MTKFEVGKAYFVGVEYGAPQYGNHSFKKELFKVLKRTEKTITLQGYFMGSGEGVKTFRISDVSNLHETLVSKRHEFAGEYFLKASDLMGA